MYFVSCPSGPFYVCTFKLPTISIRTAEFSGRSGTKLGYLYFLLYSPSDEVIFLYCKEITGRPHEIYI
jgi:hypothetical protein